MNDLTQKLYDYVDNGVNTFGTRLDQAYRNDPQVYERKLQAGWASAAGVVSVFVEYAAHKVPANDKPFNKVAKIALHAAAFSIGTFALCRVADYGKESAPPAIE